MLIDTREPLPPPPPPRQRRRRPELRLGELRPLILLVTGLALALLSSAFSPVPAYVLILVSCICIGRGLGTVVQSTSGLKDHRQ
jgi:hypothetical protein